MDYFPVDVEPKESDIARAMMLAHYRYLYTEALKEALRTGRWHIIRPLFLDEIEELKDQNAYEND